MTHGPSTGPPPEELVARAERVLAWYRLGCIQADEVTRWADQRLLECAAPPGWLMCLSVEGPEADLEGAGPRLVDLGFASAFRAWVEVTSPDDPDAVERFAAWASRAAMGEDLELEEVQLGYQLEHLGSYDEGRQPASLARAILLEHGPRCTALADELPWRARPLP